MRRLRSLGALIGAAGLLAAACGTSTSGSGGSASPSGVLTISDESGALWTCGFNPFNSSVSFLDFGPVYEPLMFVDTLESGKVSPWLASSYAWSNGNKTVTFTIRNGVKWSDGKPFSAADVVFTFNELKKYPALDLNSVWSVLSSVTQQGSNQVVMNFKNAAVPYFYYIADQVPIVPAHIWSKLSNPVTFNDPDPIAHRRIHRQVQARADHLPGEQALLAARRAEDRTGRRARVHQQRPGEHRPGYRRRHSGAPSTSRPSRRSIPTRARTTTTGSRRSRTSVSSSTSRTRSCPTSRCARPWPMPSTGRQVSQIGESGYEPPGNQTGIVTPTFSSWEDTSQAAQYNYTYNPTKAEQILTAAGFKKNSSGIFVSPSGQRAVLQCHQRGRLLGLGRVDADHPDGSQSSRHPGHAGEPGRHGLRHPPVRWQLRPRLLRRDRRPDPVLRVPSVAVLGQHRARSASRRRRTSSGTATRQPTPCSTTTPPPPRPRCSTRSWTSSSWSCSRTCRSSR